MKSISSKMFFTLFIFSSLILIIVSFVIYYGTQKFLFESQKDILHSKMELLIGSLQEEDDNEIDFELSEISGGEYAIPSSGHYFILKIKNEIISSPSVLEKDLNFKILKLINKTENEILYESIDIKKNKLLVLKKNFILFNNDIELQVAESIEESLKIIKKLNTYIYLFNFIAILILSFINYLIVKKLLKPLDLFTKEISNISSNNLNHKLNIPSNDLEIITLTKSFNNMLQNIDKAFETEKFIISESSHQLKTPLSIIQTTCDVTLKKERKIEEYKDSLLDIKETSIEMSKKINDMLSIAKLNSESIKEINFSEIDIIEVLKKSIEITNPLSEKKNIKIIFISNKSYKVKGNFDKLTEAFINIIDNAIKYSKNNSNIEIEIKSDNENILISIKDYGIGIKKEDLDKIFNRFFRASNNIASGTGLGLAISELIVKQHNGTISLSSKENEGSIFVVSIPSL